MEQMKCKSCGHLLDDHHLGGKKHICTCGFCEICFDCQKYIKPENRWKKTSIKKSSIKSSKT